MIHNLFRNMMRLQSYPCKSVSYYGKSLARLSSFSDLFNNNLTYENGDVFNIKLNNILLPYHNSSKAVGICKATSLLYAFLTNEVIEKQIFQCNKSLALRLEKQISNTKKSIENDAQNEKAILIKIMLTLGLSAKKNHYFIDENLSIISDLQKIILPYDKDHHTDLIISLKQIINPKTENIFENLFKTNPDFEGSCSLVLFGAYNNYAHEILMNITRDMKGELNLVEVFDPNRGFYTFRIDDLSGWDSIKQHLLSYRRLGLENLYIHNTSLSINAFTPLSSTPRAGKALREELLFNFEKIIRHYYNVDDQEIVKAKALLN